MEQYPSKGVHRRSPEGDRKALWKMEINSFNPYDKLAERIFINQKGAEKQ
jgi:hypothetical protein